MAIPNAERILAAYLREQLGVQVFQTVPPAPPTEYVRIHRAGGIELNRVTDNPMISISTYASDPGVAADLANRIREVMFAARGRWLPSRSSTPRAWCRWWKEATGPSYYPDPDKPDRTRYQFSGELRLATNT